MRIIADIRTFVSLKILYQYPQIFGDVVIVIGNLIICRILAYSPFLDLKSSNPYLKDPFHL